MRVKRGVVLSDDDDEEVPKKAVNRRPKGKARAPVFDSDDEEYSGTRSDRAMWDIDDGTSAHVLCGMLMNVVAQRRSSW